jgi:hypothetical protein
MLARAIRLAALLVFLVLPAFADAVMAADPGEHAPAPADDFEGTAVKRAEILANDTRLGACHDLLDDLYQWGVLDLVATGIAFGLINNTTRSARRAAAAGNHRLGRAHADFVIGFCTATMHIHMANRDGARDRPDLSAQNAAIGPVLQSRITRLQSRAALTPDHCRAHMRKLKDANVIDQVAEVMLGSELDNAIRRRASVTLRQDSSQGFDHGLCAAVLNALMGALR